MYYVYFAECAIHIEGPAVVEGFVALLLLLTYYTRPAVQPKTDTTVWRTGMLVKS